MIIVSQDKNIIYNFDNTNCIYIRKSEKECSIILFDNTYCIEGDGDCIGIYKTEERAKEVFQEIINKYERGQWLQDLSTSGNKKIPKSSGDRDYVYEMPEE